MPVLRLQTVVVGERLTQNDVIEHLDNPDATTVSLMGQEGEYLLVLFEGLFVHLHGKGIVFQFHQRGKRMPVPEVQRIELVLHHHVEVPDPLFLIVEPREVLGCVRVFIDGMSWQILRLLQSDAGAAHHHLRTLVNHWCRETGSVF